MLYKFLLYLLVSSIVLYNVFVSYHVLLSIIILTLSLAPLYATCYHLYSSSTVVVMFWSSILSLLIVSTYAVSISSSHMAIYVINNLVSPTTLLSVM